MTKPCKRWTGKFQTGREYGYLYVEGRRWYAHRWVFFQAHGYLPPVVRHSCDNGWCIEETHLIGGTQADNLRDMFERGRARRAQGEAAPKAKLTEGQVREIRRRFAAGERRADLASRI